MNRPTFHRAIGLVWLIALLSACNIQSAPQATDTPTSTVEGQVIPWGAGSPVDNRHIVLCRITAQAEAGECLLSDSAATTDDQGQFTISGLAAGTYYVLYDSGLSDFDAALERWGGQQLRFANSEWLSDYLGVDIDEDWVTFHLPEGLSFSPHEGWLCDYCRATLMMGDSPFLLAHELETFATEHRVVHVLAQVPESGTTQLAFHALYFGDVQENGPAKFVWRRFEP